MTAQLTTNGPTNTPAKPTPFKSGIAHLVLRTSPESKQSMVDFYCTFLGAWVAHSNPVVTFLRYDSEHHRIALVTVPGTRPKDRHTAGIEHIAFDLPSLPALAAAYKERKAVGILPVWCVNHGITTSMYYMDPDGHMIELQVDNLDEPEQANEYMEGPLFAENPIGVDFDADEFVRLVDGAGEEELAQLKKRKNIGPRSMPPDFLM